MYDSRSDHLRVAINKAVQFSEFLLKNKIIVSMSAVDLQKQALLRHSSHVAGLTLLSRCAGFLRDVVIAYVFGATAAVDAFLIAFKIPNFLRRLFAEGAFAQAFVPVLCDYQNKDPQIRKRFIDHMAGHLLLLMLLLAVTGMVLAPNLVHLFAPGFIEGSARFGLTVSLLHITLPYALLIVLVALGGAILNVYGNFVIPSALPILLNVVIIFFAVLANLWYPPIAALAWAIIVAGLLQLVWVFAVLKRKCLMPVPRWQWSDPGVRRVWSLLLPALLGVSVSQINIIISSIFASHLSVGSVAWLFYAERLSSFPLGILAAALATVSLPVLARAASCEDHHTFQNTLAMALRWVLILGIPAGVGLWFCSVPIVTTLLAYGRFNQLDVQKVSECARGFALGIPFLMLLKINIGACYAKKAVWLSVRVGLLAVIINIIANILLVPRLAQFGLALSASLAGAIYAIILMALMIQRDWLLIQKEFFILLGRISFAVVVMAWVLAKTTAVDEQWWQWSASQRAFHLLIGLIFAMVSYLLSLIMMGVRYRTQKI